MAGDGRIRRLSRETVHTNPRVHLHRDWVRHPSGNESVYWVVDHQREGVGIVPVLNDGRIVLGRHHRYCPNEEGWEIPAGTVDQGEDRAECARRELIEETGYDCSRIEFLLDYFPAPGLGTEHFHLFIARGLTHVSDKVDGDEILEVRAFSWDEIAVLIRTRQIIDGFSLTGLGLARSLGMI